MSEPFQPTTDNIAPRKAAIYARVSTENQEKQQTIDSQIDEVKRRIEVDGNILTEDNIYIDEGWSGMLLARPALDQLRDAVSSKRCDMVYVYDLGRLSRDFTNQLVLIKEIEDSGVKVVSLHDINPENDEQGFIRNILGSFHEYERVKIADRMRRGKLYKARNGSIINGNAIYGYSYIKKSGDIPASWVINEQEAKVVRMIWQWVGEEGESIRGVIKRLYDMGITPRKQKRPIWTKGPIVRILQCNTYVTGKAHYNKSEATVAKRPRNSDRYKKVKRTSRKVRPIDEWIPFDVPIIIQDMALYEKVQRIFELNKKYANKKSKGKYLFTGRIFCQCGSRMNGDGCNKYGHFYYRCTSRIHKFPLDTSCKAGGVNAKLLDTLLWNALKKQISDSVLLRQYAEEWLQSKQKHLDVSEEVERLQSTLNSLSQEEVRYAKAYGAGSLDLSLFTNLIKNLRSQKSDVQEKMSGIMATHTSDISPVEVDELVKESLEVIEKLDWDNKIATVRDIIDRVIVREQTGVEVFVHLPIPSTQKLDYELESRHRRASQCGKIHVI